MATWRVLEAVYGRIYVVQLRRQLAVVFALGVMLGALFMWLVK